MIPWSSHQSDGGDEVRSKWPDQLPFSQALYPIHSPQKPNFGDPFFWAKRVKNLGIGAGLGKLSVKTLCSALHLSTSDLTQISRARIIGQLIWEENKAAKVVECLYCNLDYARCLVKCQTSNTTIGPSLHPSPDTDTTNTRLLASKGKQKAVPIDTKQQEQEKEEPHTASSKSAQAPIDKEHSSDESASCDIFSQQSRSDPASEPALNLSTSFDQF
ncbi:hypothetical protein PtB15_1B535 [Puccinia triticina]|nr:hypothetical protein PtB15_1B535 [Puccinia triticina]